MLPVSQNETPCHDEPEVSFRDLKDFSALNQASRIPPPEQDGPIEIAFISKKEKIMLEEIQSLTALTRVPLDDRQMIFFRRDAKNLKTKVKLVPEDVPSKDLNAAAGLVKESVANIQASNLQTLAMYLQELKNIIAHREIKWASMTDCDYAQKVEIMRLKNEVSHLRVICARRETEIEEKNKIISARESEIGCLKKIVQKMKMDMIKN